MTHERVGAPYMAAECSPSVSPLRVEAHPKARPAPLKARVWLLGLAPLQRVLDCGPAPGTSKPDADADATPITAVMASASIAAPASLDLRLTCGLPLLWAAM